MVKNGNTFLDCRGKYKNGWEKNQLFFTREAHLSKMTETRQENSGVVGKKLRILIQNIKKPIKVTCQLFFFQTLFTKKKNSLKWPDKSTIRAMIC